MLRHRRRFDRPAQLRRVGRIVRIVAHATGYRQMLWRILLGVIALDAPRRQCAASVASLTLLPPHRETHDLGMFGIRPVLGERMVGSRMTLRTVERWVASGIQHLDGRDGLAGTRSAYVLVSRTVAVLALDVMVPIGLNGIPSGGATQIVAVLADSVAP